MKPLFPHLEFSALQISNLKRKVKQLRKHQQSKKNSGNSKGALPRTAADLISFEMREEIGSIVRIDLDAVCPSVRHSIELVELARNALEKAMTADNGIPVLNFLDDMSQRAKGFYRRVYHDTTSGQLSRIFMMTEQQVIECRLLGDVLFIDATENTNNAHW